MLEVNFQVVKVNFNNWYFNIELTAMFCVVLLTHEEYGHSVEYHPCGFCGQGLQVGWSNDGGTAGYILSAR